MMPEHKSYLTSLLPANLHSTVDMRLRGRVLASCWASSPQSFHLASMGQAGNVSSVTVLESLMKKVTDSLG